MATAPLRFNRVRTLADVLARLGAIPPERVWLRPLPGNATVQDVITADVRHNRLCELIDGVLVEKTLGSLESMLALRISIEIGLFLRTHDLGFLLGADGMLEISPSQVRIPDVSFISWERVPNRKLPEKTIFDLAPDLAVEILSTSNTREEMARKLRDYFAAGCRLVWYVDPKSRTIRAYTSPKGCVRHTMSQTIDGGDVLPGFKLPLRNLFQPPLSRRK